MALPALVTLAVRQGDSWSRTLTLTEDDGSTPIDLTGCSVEFSIAKARRKSPSWTFVDTEQAGITDPAGGEITLSLGPDDSRAFGKLEELEFEVTVTFAGGERLTVLEGTLTNRLEVANQEDEEVDP